ncbi:hypothetical protein F5X68DRAFT_67764 [Plectosphaerella plurivora]|uniref:Uncharacterized protein n=1 Tax=Plectosphaerella plurivora TaxID=936078 RepID=A0A9P9AFM0_9PEZI|nr:hypothetical protein F5X68DRAFT_67764 [Plectosphaerella plurivora]
MASRPTARASRAAIRQVRTPLESIWITDSILTSAFERYCNIDRLLRRKSSNVPGPLENRRRLGTRKMTGLYSTELQPTLPPWMFESPVDLSQWTWSPPTSAEERMKNKETREGTPLATSGFWQLWSSGAEAAKAQPSQPALEEVVVQAPSDNYSYILEKASEALFQSLSKRELTRQYSHVMRGLQQDIYLGRISADDIPDMLAGFTHKVEQLLEHAHRDWTDGLPPSVEAKFKLATLQFVDAIIRGLTTSKVQGLEQLESETCNKLLAMLSELPQSKEAVMLFQEFMQTAPESYATQVSSGIETYLRTWLTEIKKPQKHLVTALVNGSLDIQEGTRLFDTLSALHTKMLAGKERDESIHVHTVWLVFLAHSSKVSTPYFFDALERYTTFAENWSRSRERQVCQLLLRHWRSRKTFSHWESRTASRTFDDWEHPDIRTFGHFIYSIRFSGQRKAFVGIVTRLASREVLVKSIIKYVNQAESLCGRRLGFIASDLDDYDLALTLLELTEVHRHKLISTTHPLQLALLPWLKDMVLDPRMDVSRVWDVVNSLREDNEKMMELKKLLMPALSTWFSMADHLGDRAMLRNVSRCNAWVRSAGERPSPDNLLAVTRAGIRDLKRGEPGRFERHDWLVRLNTDCLGSKQGLKMAKLLGEWQDRNMAAQRQLFY